MQACSVLTPHCCRAAGDGAQQKHSGLRSHPSKVGTVLMQFRLIPKDPRVCSHPATCLLRAAAQLLCIVQRPRQRLADLQQ